MSKETINTKKPLNPNDLYQLITNARSSFKSYKLSASSAAANAYLLWRDTMAFGAPREGNDWMMGEIAKRNEEIKKHNEDLKKERKYAEDYMNGKLSADEWINQPGKNKEEKDEIAAERKRLAALAKRDAKEWDRLKLVPIEKREGASQFTEIVKYVFEFDKSAHASLVNRFCLALEWVHDAFGGKVVETIDEIVDRIEEGGGFEIIVEDQRLGERSDAPPLSILLSL